MNPDPIRSASSSPASTCLENRNGLSHKSRKRPLQEAPIPPPPAAKFGRYQVYECDTLSFEETFVHNALKQSGFIHDKDDSELIRSVSTLTLATSCYFETAILSYVAQCTQVCQTIAKHLSARDILSLSQLNRFTYQEGRHRNRLLTSILVERYCRQPPAIQEKLKSFTDQTFSKTTPPKLTEWLEKHFAPQDKSWVESEPSRLAALARYLYKRSITIINCDTIQFQECVRTVISAPNDRIICDQYNKAIVLDLNQARKKKSIAALSGHKRGINCVTTHPKGWTISTSSDGTLRIWDLNQPTGRECIATLEGRHYGQINCVATHPKGWVISGSFDNTVRIWDLDYPRGMECSVMLSGHSRMVNCITAHPEGWVISGSSDRTIKIWDLDQPRGTECIATLRGHTSMVTCLVIHPKGWVISCSYDKTVRIWDLSQPRELECIATLTGHSDWVNCMTSLSDLIISGSYDRTLKVWDLNQPRGMECIATLTENSSCVESVTTASDDRVICGCVNGTLKVRKVSIDTSKGLID